MARITTPKQLVKAFNKYGSVKKAAKATGSSWPTTQQLYKKAVAEGLMAPQRVGRKTNEEIKNPKALSAVKPMERIHPLTTKVLETPPEGVKRYLFTCAQNNTKVHNAFWDNLMVLKDHYQAELHVARFVYFRSGLGAAEDKGLVLKRKEVYGGEDLWWDDKVVPYISDDRIQVAPGLVWCGESNTLPTAERPLQGLESYTGRKSGIFPHTKLAMDSIPSNERGKAKFNFTTGTVTLRNYIQRKAGLKAEFHHCFAALLIEVDADGDWFPRQINADSDGTICDLNLMVRDGVLTDENRVVAITWDDIHESEIDAETRDMSFVGGAFKESAIVDVLKPEHQFFHDVLGFRSAGHHELKNPHKRFKLWYNGMTDVTKELQGVKSFLELAARPWCNNVVVDSNHHHHLGRWLQEQNGLLDPSNAEVWIDLQQRVYAETRHSNPRTINYLKLAMQSVGLDDDLVQFLEQDESYIVCPEHGGGVECGIHGHAGPNGSRGSARNLSRIGRKANVGHYHSATIFDGVYAAGTMGDLNPDWTSGPSSWSHSFVVTYKNGKRAIIIRWNGKWRGENKLADLSSAVAVVSKRKAPNVRR